MNHHHTVPFHLLRDVPELSVGEPGAGNLIVQGDNLVALKALLPYYAGQVKCIYIDPPYNTGNEGWVYNDNVNSPLIREWLGKTVGKETEDLSRHDKWLCMMYPRLALLRQFLRPDGAIFVSIDDNEAFHLRLLMDEIFSANNFLCSFAWEKRYAPPPDTKDIGYLHETVLGYRRSDSFRRNLLPQTSAQVGRYKNPDDDPRGPWKAMDYTCRFSKQERPNLFYPIKNPFTGETVWPNEQRVWSCTSDEHAKNEAEKRLWWGKKGTAKVPAKKNFLSGIQQGIMPTTLLRYQDVGHTHEATQALIEILPAVKMTPKPPRLVQHLALIASDPGDLILDSFAGSGTTGHAVLQLNSQTPPVGTGSTPSLFSGEDGDGVEPVPTQALRGRRFILVEMEPKIAREITAERVKRVAQGYTKAKGEKVEGLGGGFRFCELGEPLFDQHGQIRASVTFADLARHVYFTETGEPLPRERVSKSPLIGECRGLGVYLLFNGILGDKSASGGNILTRAVLAKLPKLDGPKVIYASGCLLGRERLQAERITFRQTPYEIKVA